MHRKSLFGLFSLVILVAVISLVTSESAFAQSTSSTGVPSVTSSLGPRLSLDGIGGVTFSHEPGGLYAGGVTIRASHNVQILGEAGRLTNVLPKSVSESLNATAATFVANGNTGFIYDAKMPGNYVLGSVRVTSKPNAAGIMPFVEGGAGFAHVTTNVTASAGGVDMTDFFVSAINPPLTASQTKPMFTVGGGLTIRAGRKSAVDLGYRYGRIMTDNIATPTNRLYAGLRFGL